MTATRVRILGTVEVAHGPSAVVARGRMQRLLLAELAAAGGAPVAKDSLIEALWGEAPPAGAEHSLQQHVTSLRKVVGGLGHPSPAGVVVGRSNGYALEGVLIDAQQFESRARTGLRAVGDRQWRAAAEDLDAALELWKGEPFDGDTPSERLVAAATRLRSVRRSVMEARFEMQLAGGAASALVPDLEAALRDHPFDEAFGRQLMLALYRSGRQADALNVFQRLRNLLVEELGVEPSAESRQLEQDMLLQRPELDADALSGERPPAELFSTLSASAEAELPSLELGDGQRIHLASDVALVGRDDDVDVRLVDRRVSRRHASIERAGTSWTLLDLGSTNGTFLDGERIASAELEEGAVISFGGLTLTFRSGTAGS